MQTEDSQKVIDRFFQALYYLKQTKVIRGKQTFTARYGINRWNLNSPKKTGRETFFRLRGCPISSRITTSRRNGC